MDPVEAEGQLVRVGNAGPFRSLEAARPTSDGWRLYLADENGDPVRLELAREDAHHFEVLREDGSADPARALAGLWSHWMRASSLDAKATVLATSPLKPYAHQSNAVYGAMLPQPRLRFLLADEPGTGKTIMAGMYLREAQRLGLIDRALVVTPAHLVTKWQEDFDRFFGGQLKRITNDTVREGALGIDHDLWVVSLNLAAVNHRVQEEIRPDQTGWDMVVFDEAHRLTPSAERFYHVGEMLCSLAPQVLLMTATPHRGKEWLFRSLMNLVDPELFPDGDDSGSTRHLKPPSTHFLRRMKEDLRDHDGETPLFAGRRATNFAVALNRIEAGYYQEALDLVNQFFPADAKPLARIVYGKRAASSLHALVRTLTRRRQRMGSTLPTTSAAAEDPYSDDEATRQEAEVLVQRSSSERAEKAAIDELLGRLEPVAADSDTPVSKWRPAIERCLVGNGIHPGGEDQAVVFTEYADTADWLVDRFRDARYTAERYSGRDPHVQRDVVRERFARRDFQILVSTDAGNEGIDLQTAHVLVNWDIPWSLVTLEQRMGRIHRVGQTRDVELYNLVATDTREGDVLHALLESFVTAANRLDGKMFDSLSAVGEISGIDLDETLRPLYGDDAPAAARARRRVDAATADELEKIARQAAEQEEHLRTSVNYAAAVEELQNETLERINPRIVEAYLDRLDRSRHLSVEPDAAGEGLFTVRAAPETAAAQALGGTDTLVATDDGAVRAARAAGSAVENAVPLGPSTGAFRELAECVAEEISPDLLRGAHLVDRSSTTDYALYCYEAAVTDGHGRTRGWPFLVQVDDSGADDVAWEALATIESTAAEPRTPHPAWRADADAQASATIDAEQERRHRALRDWLDSSRQSWRRLPSQLTNEMSDAARRRSERTRIRQAVDDRLARLEQAATVTFGAPRAVGWIIVTGAAEPDNSEDSRSEHVAIAHVAERLRHNGWSVRDMQTKGVGYDLRATRGRELRCVEVKGVADSASSTGIRLVGNELLAAQQQRENFWLYVVERCRDGTGSLYGAYPDPISAFADQLRYDTVVRVPGSALKNALDETVSA